MKKHLRSIGLIAAFAVGGLLHEPLSLLRDLLPWSIGLMLGLSFLGVDAQKLKPEWRQLWLLLIIQAAGLLYWGLASLAGYPVLAEALYYCGAAPIATACPVIVNILKGRVPTAYNTLPTFTTLSFSTSQISDTAILSDSGCC